MVNCYQRVAASIWETKIYFVFEVIICESFDIDIVYCHFVYIYFTLSCKINGSV